MQLLIKIIFLLFFINSYSQKELVKQDEIIHTVESLILSQKKDSAFVVLKKLKKNDYVSVLERVIKDENVSYQDYKVFTDKVSNRLSNKYSIISEFIDKNIKEPKHFLKVNLDYVDIKWLQISKLVDNAITLEESSLKQRELEIYLNKFNNNDVNVLRVKTKITTHPIVMLQIQENVIEGKKLCLKGLQTAKEINDKELQIIFLYHLTDFLILERKLQEYIDISE